MYSRIKKRNIFTIVWILISFFILPKFEQLFGSFISSISILFYLISFIIGFYNAYHFTIWIESKISNTGFGLWTRRVVAGILMLVGFGFSALWMFGVALTAITAPSSHTIVPFVSVSSLIASFFIGLAVFAAYIEFTFERRAGILISHDNQRF